MEKKRTQKVTSWGGFPVVEKEIIYENSLSRLKQMVQQYSSVIPRGNGRSYGDAALGERMLSTKRLNKFISFDRINGVLETESGVLLSEILEVVVPQGYFLMVTPGTKFISVGGAIASDVHGKNHHAEGCFSDSLIAFKILTSDGEVKECSRDENTSLFWTTVGGMGLTGLILSAKFQLKNIETPYIRQESIKAENLDEIFRLFEESEDWTYTVAWIDCLQKGDKIGRSILMRGEHALRSELPKSMEKKGLKIPKKFSPTVPFYFPSFVLNAWSVKIFNWLYYAKQSKKIVKNYIDYETFFYPLDAINHWNKIYGKKGFIQYQMVIPKRYGKEGMRKILKTIADSGNGSFLAVLKLFGKNNPEAFNAFPMEGYTLALDFKVNKKLPKLVRALDDIVAEYGGRIYLTKDSMSRAELTNYLKGVDNATFESLQRKRILTGKNYEI
ncbi:FAD-binding oxidoreductase [Bergeyella zoohelcum]|uniref:Probable decaprenylphosphoryl-beta-D-ribose oxidase n=1 Tax=Bergeyella zoohelcum TaxID=1015 RepID=A0A376C0Z7_9FLAO|nr:FAD-binding oxidoreductase [Bergeyella zoohelcum]EKB57651.1 hypothetical protein HMPREF9700_02176 [Bergeyella zoohelcum CCUG 30536]MDY6025899.1 FAD-binding oxidoreductase [Bergeyella zoohelcum]SSZ55684.1 Probable decaprenylphosphoryl-beta-D-ribose oxidase [Bergeyella zoohelcum]